MITCFIAEDEQILRRGLILTIDWDKMGCKVIGEAANGSKALMLIKKLKPDIVITDIRMPIMDGLSLIEQSLSCYHPEFIIISGYNDFSYAKKAIRLGVSDYLCKPIDEEELKQTVERVCKKIIKKREVLPPNIPVKIIATNDIPFAQFKEYSNEYNTGKNKYILKAIRFIEDNYSRNITIADVCRKLIISESYLIKLFKKYTGYSFIEYLTYIRIKNACILLNNDDTKIYTAAEKVGYKDQRYFSALFKKYTGLTPKQFKERQYTVEKASDI